jgi:hypothetical protein
MTRPWQAGQVAGRVGAVSMRNPSKMSLSNMGPLRIPTSCPEQGRHAVLNRTAGDSGQRYSRRMQHPNLVDTAADARWLAWKARGAASDLRSGRLMGRAFAIVVVLVLGFLVALSR